MAWVGFGFSVSLGCWALCRVVHRRDRYLPGDITCLPPKPVRLGERFARVCLPLGLKKKIKRRDGTDALPIMYFLSFLVKNFS